jgi:hypothetical protein
MSLAWFWSLLLVGATVLLSVAGTLMVRRLISVEVLERHNEVAGFIYAVIGVVYAVLLGFAAITVWERYVRISSWKVCASRYRSARSFASCSTDADRRARRSPGLTLLRSQSLFLVTSGTTRERN